MGSYFLDAYAQVGLQQVVDFLGFALIYLLFQILHMAALALVVLVFGVHFDLGLLPGHLLVQVREQLLLVRQDVRAESLLLENCDESFQELSELLVLHSL